MSIEKIDSAVQVFSDPFVQLLSVVALLDITHKCFRGFLKFFTIPITLSTLPVRGNRFLTLRESHI